MNGFFFVIDCIFFAANSTKLIEGGWFPLLLAAVVAFLMLTWRSGVKLVERARGALRQPEEDLIETAITKCHARLSGTAVFLASAANGVPLALTQFVKHNHVLHQRVVLVTVLIEEAPRIPPEDRAEIVEVVEGITRVILHYGFMQYPTIYEGLRLACEQGKLPGIDLTDITYYIGRETIIPSQDVAGMAMWRETVFAFLQRNAERSAAFFGVPPGRSSSSVPRSRFEWCAGGAVETGLRRMRFQAASVTPNEVSSERASTRSLVAKPSVNRR